MATADYSKLNVCQKLNLARKMFLEAGTTKSGKNTGIGFYYFELEDIVPKVTSIFNEIGLISIVNFTDTDARMEIVNTDNLHDEVMFTSPVRFLEGNKGMNALQALGAMHTYIRRYLYMMALDIIEADSVDGTPLPEKPKAAAVTKEAEKPVAKPKSKKQPTAEESKQKVAELTSANENAPQEEIKQLIDACNQLLDKDPDQEDFVKQIIDMTDGLKKVTSDQVKNLLAGIGELMTAYE